MNPRDRNGVRRSGKQLELFDRLLPAALLLLMTVALHAATPDLQPTGELSLAAEVVDVDGGPVRRASISFLSRADRRRSGAKGRCPRSGNRPVVAVRQRGGNRQPNDRHQIAQRDLSCAGASRPLRGYATGL